MTRIKELRLKHGFTQKILAEKSGLSLRTIQRLEAGSKKPKGHSLTELAKVFQVTPSDLQEKIQSDTKVEADDKLILKFINLSTFAFFIIPFGNLIFPLIIWYRKKDVPLVNEHGRTLINFQIMWTIILCFSLSVSPFLNINNFISTPLILLVLFAALGINLIVVCLNAYMIHDEKFHYLKRSFIKFL